jgi:hypothetical protein
MFAIFIHHRHWQRWILNGTKSAIEERIIWRLHCKQTQWDNFSMHPSHIPHLHSIQTLTTLDLGRNQIGGEGAQYLAHALETNTVRKLLYSSIKYSRCPFITDTYNAVSWKEPNRWWRSTIFGECIANEHRKRTFLLIHYMFTVSLKTDIDNTESLRVQTRR